MAREMKDSGIEWIGEIPTCWETDRLQWHLKEINVSNNPIQTEEVLSLTIEAGVIPYAEKGNQGNKAKEDCSQYKIAFPNTLVVNSMNIIIGAVGISHYYGCVSPVYYVFRAAEGSDLRYIYYLFTNVGFQKEMRKYAKGILEIRLRISASDMLRLRIPNPSYSEQSRIADFLDRRCAEIDRVIDQTRSSIEEYKKLKQAIITQAVTKGIQPDRKMKDSGINWIGEIPENWHLIRIKHLANDEVDSFQDGDWIESPVITNSGIRYLTTGNVGDGVFKRQGNGYITEETFVSLNCKYAYPKDLVISRLNAPYGRACILPDDEDKYVLAVDIVILRTNHDKQFLCYLMQCTGYQWIVQDGAKGTTMKRISRTNLGNIVLPIAPLSEQSRIAAFLDRRCSEIDCLIDAKQQLMSQLESYKKSLIFEYVTGKKEVPA